jgi:hypothetical protein
MRAIQITIAQKHCTGAASGLMLKLRRMFSRLLLLLSPRLPVKCGAFTYYVPAVTLLRLGGPDGFRRSVFGVNSLQEIRSGKYDPDPAGNDQLISS